MARIGAWAALALLTVYLVFVGGGWQGIYTSLLRTVSVVLAGAVLVVWAVVAWRESRWRPRSSLMPAILACLASLAISTVFSQHPRLSVEYLGYAIVLAALYLFLVRLLANPWFRARMMVLGVSLFIAISGLFIGRVVSLWAGWWADLGRVTLPPLRPNSESLVYGNPSAVMTIDVLLGCAALAWIGVESRRARIAVAVGTVALGLVSLVSGSRSGWLAAGVAGIGIGLVALLSPDRRASLTTSIRFALRAPAIRIAAGVAAVAVVAAGVAFGPAVLLRVTSGGEDLRAGYVVTAMRMFGESPVVGLGPGMWVTNRIVETETPSPDYYIPHAHDIYVQAAAELGIVGLVAGLVLALSLVRLLRDAVRDIDPARRRWGWAAALAIAYFALHQVLDLFVNMPAILFAAALPIALVDASAGNEGAAAPTRFQTLPAVGAAAGLVIALISVVGLVAAEFPAQRHATAVADANAGNWGAALEPARDAVRMDPDWPPYQVTLGLALSRSGDHAGAAAAFERAATVDDLPESWLNLAAEQTQLGRPSEALASIRQAMRLGYQRTAISGAAGELALRLGDPAAAIDALAWAVAVTPSFAGDPWWQADPARAGLLDAVVDLAIARTTASNAPASSANAWEIAAMAGQFDRASDLAKELGGETGTLALEVVEALQGNDGAYRDILAQCDAKPLSFAPAVWCARLATRHGDVTLADHYRIVGYPVGFGYESLSDLRVSQEPLVGRTVEGGVASFYGTYTYRRATPWDLLVPSLVHFTVQ